MIWGGAVLMVVAGLVCTAYRLIQGPTAFDRVLCLDGISVSILALMAIYGMQTGSELFIDVALVLAPVNFIATIGYSYYLYRTHPEGSDSSGEESV
jgi:multicomponent K+:H+ antiporter subunit F